MSTEANKALVRRFYEEIDKAIWRRWMNWSPRTTSTTRHHRSLDSRQVAPVSSRRSKSSGSRHLASTTSRSRSPRETRSSPGFASPEHTRMISWDREDREQAGDDGDGDPQDRRRQARREVVEQGRAWLPPATRRHPYARRSRLLSVGSQPPLSQRFGGMTVSGLRALVVLAVGVFALPSSADADLASVRVHNPAEFAAAVSALRDTGGTIRLRRNDYGGELVVRSRFARPLRIVGERGSARRESLLEGTQNISISRLTITPIVQDAWLRIRGSRHVVVEDVLVTAKGTWYRATVQVHGSNHVVIRRSEFRHCGDRSPLFSNFLRLQERTRHVQVVDNWFHDCRGCDFIHGRFGYDLTLRGNRFERALRCRMSGDRCRHQDLVSFSSGNRLLVERNTFGVYRYGAAQLYLIRGVDRVSIINNVFRGTDRKVAGYQARVAIIVGSRVQSASHAAYASSTTPSSRDTPHRRLCGLDPDERRVLATPAVPATTPREQRHRPPRGSAPRLQCHPRGHRERRAPRSCVPRPESCRPGAPGPLRAPNERVNPAHRSREQTAERSARHRWSSPWRPAGHRGVRIPFGA